MRIMLSVILFVAVPVVTSAAVIKEYLRDTMHLYKSNGDYDGPFAKASLPPPQKLSEVKVLPLRVSAVGPGGKSYIFRSSEVLIDTGAEGAPACEPIKVAQRGTNLHLGADDLGAGSGLSQTATPCIKP